MITFYKTLCFLLPGVETTPSREMPCRTGFIPERSDHISNPYSLFLPILTSCSLSSLPLSYLTSKLFSPFFSLCSPSCLSSPPFLQPCKGKPSPLNTAAQQCRRWPLAPLHLLPCKLRSYTAGSQLVPVCIPAGSS